MRKRYADRAERHRYDGEGPAALRITFGDLEVLQPIRLRLNLMPTPTPGTRTENTVPALSMRFPKVSRNACRFTVQRLKDSVETL